MHHARRTGERSKRRGDGAARPVTSRLFGRRGTSRERRDFLVQYPAASDRSQRELDGRPHRTVRAATSVRLLRTDLVFHPKFGRTGEPPASSGGGIWSSESDALDSLQGLAESPSLWSSIAVGLVSKRCTYNRSPTTEIEGMERGGI